MNTPDWTNFRDAAGADPQGPCCLLESSFSVKDLPRNYIWTLGYLGQWVNAEAAEISAQVKSYSREWLVERANLLDSKRKEAEVKELEYQRLKAQQMQETETRTEHAARTLKDKDAIQQRIEAGPLKMAKGFLQSAADLATGGTTDPKDRMDICNSCPFKTDNGRCGKCGCVLAAKTRVKKSTCPIGKW